jgi:preprotein translocase subunit YajC
MIISTAIAQTTSQQAAGPDLFFQLIPILGLFAVMYFLMIRPQQKRQKELRAMLEGLQVGDEVIVAGGIYGKVISLTDQKVVVDLAVSSGQPLLITIQKGAVQTVLPKGSLDAVKMDIK